MKGDFTRTADVNFSNHPISLYHEESFVNIILINFFSKTLFWKNTYIVTLISL